MPLQDKVDQRVKLIAEAREFLSECEKDHQGLTADETARFNKMHDDADTLKAEIDDLAAEEKSAADRVARQEKAEQDLESLRGQHDFDKLKANQIIKQNLPNAPGINRLQAVDHTLQNWALNGRAACDADPQFRDNFKASGCSWDSGAGGLHVPLLNQAPKSLADIRNAQSVGTATEGGHTTFPGFVSSLETALLQFGGMRQAATILRTATGSSLDWPTVNDTTNTGALLAENIQDSELDAVFGNLTLDAYKYTSKLVLVSKELMNDSAFNMGQVIGTILGERLGRIQNTHATTGTGSSQPNGIVTASTAGVTAASATVVTMDEVMNLEASVDAAYRPGAMWMFNDTTRNEIRQLKSADSIYHWQPGAQAGDPDMLLGYPFIVNNDMADTATAEKSILFGQLSKYLIREVLGVTLVQLNERYADYHQVAFVAIMRFDGDLLDAGTNPVKHLVQA